MVQPAKNGSSRNQRRKNIFTTNKKQEVQAQIFRKYINYECRKFIVIYIITLTPFQKYGLSQHAVFQLSSKRFSPDQKYIAEQRATIITTGRAGGFLYTKIESSIRLTLCVGITYLPGQSPAKYCRRK